MKLSAVQRIIIVSPAFLTLMMGCRTIPPRVSPPPGAYNCPQNVTISDAKAAASIFYTVGGTAPTTSSTRYTTPFWLNNTDKVEAIAVAPGAKASRVVTATYTCAPNLTHGGFAVLLQQHFSLPQPATPLTFTDVNPGDPIYSSTQAIAPYVHRQVFCPGCQLTTNFYPDEPISRGLSAITLVSIIIAQGKLQLLSATESENVLSAVADATSVPPLAHRYVATAIKNGILPLLPGNTIQPAVPYSQADMSAALALIQKQFNMPPMSAR